MPSTSSSSSPRPLPSFRFLRRRTAVLFALAAEVPRNSKLSPLSQSQSLVSVAATPPPRLFYRIEAGGSLPPTSFSNFDDDDFDDDDFDDDDYRQLQLDRLQRHRRTPPNAHHPSYFPSAGEGGRPRHRGGDGLVVVDVASEEEERDVPRRLRANFFFLADDKIIEAAQTYLVPGHFSNNSNNSNNSNDSNNNNHSNNETASPRHRLATVRAWGAGGGGCGGRTDADVALALPERRRDEDDDDEDDAFYDRDDDGANINRTTANRRWRFSAGQAGGYVEATFRLAVGDALTIVVGGGGGAGGKDGTLAAATSLGGKGGQPRGEGGRSDRFGGGGGGGGMTTVSLADGTLLLAAFGGEGGGGTEYCPPRGGKGGRIMVGNGNGTLNGGSLDLGRIYVPPEREPTGPGVPVTTALAHDGVSFSWDAGSDDHLASQEDYIHRYVVSLARGMADNMVNEYDSDNNMVDDERRHGKIKCPDAQDPSYLVHDHIPRSFVVAHNSTTTIRGLDANTPYCFLVRAFSKSGTDLGNRILPFRTKPEPANEWISIPIREEVPNRLFEAEQRRRVNDDDDDDDDNNNNNNNNDDNNPNPNPNPNNQNEWSWCEHSDTRPTGRRGHSMTTINNQVYIFGGVTLKCICETIDSPMKNSEKRCSTRNVYSDEVFHFDPITAMFSLLESAPSSTSSGNGTPEGREQHSATVLADGNGIVVVAGVTSTNIDDTPSIGEDASQRQLLSDVWRLANPHRVSTIEAPAVGHRNDSTTTWPLKLIPGQITRHVITVDIDDGSVDREEERMCVKDVRVKLSMEHSCPSAIEYIALAGPGTSLGSVDGFDFLPPQSYYYEAELYVSSADNLKTTCHPETLNLSFSDHEEESVLSRSGIPSTGKFRPASGLAARFQGTDANNGPWELLIAQRSPTQEESIIGRLLDWRLILDVTPCVATAKWERLPSPPDSFEPRRLHASVAVGDSLFISGGFGRASGSAADRRLNDLWRFDYDSRSFTELSASPRDETLSIYGQVALLGPFGLLGYGGVAPGGPRPQGKDLWLRDIFENDWVSVPVKHGSEAASQSLDKKIPYGRYLSSIGLLDSGSLRQIYNIDGTWPVAITVGGDGALLYNGYNDQYGFTTNSLFDDVWILSTGAITTNGSMNKKRRRDYCDWRQLPTSTSVQIWNGTCGWNDSASESTRGICRWDEILIRAWCLEQYQSFYLS